MNYRYLPMTDQDRNEMLSTLGIKHIDELFRDIPSEIRLKGLLNLSEPQSEIELLRTYRKMAQCTANSEQYTCFLGAGIYDHYIPSTVNHVISRSEFYTAYTPYQPEISQGELQALFEFQTMICELTGMEVANSSMYDGPTAVAEAANLAVAGCNRSKVIISKAVDPQTRSILKLHSKAQKYNIMEINLANGMTDIDDLTSKIDQDTAAIIIQYPNFFGAIEQLSVFQEIADHYQSLFIVCANPLSLGVLEPPGNYGADIVVGDMQSLGIPMQFGGPSCGYFTCSERWMRRMPGRIVGQTTDTDGKRGFVLTLQTREQHIRREKAASNICSNQALNALAAAVTMSALGKRGIQEMALLNIQKTQYLIGKLKSLKNIVIPFDRPVFNEFVIKCPYDVTKVNKELFKHSIIGGYDLGRLDNNWKNHMLIAVTELRTKQELDIFSNLLEEICDVEK